MLTPTSANSSGGLASLRRWDPVVKITHWAVVAAVLANAVVTEEGSAPHIWVGYSLAAVLAARLLWGFIGPVEARFSAFPPSPRRAIEHIREIRTGRKEVHSSHNPLGALMVYAIWGTLSVIIATGIMMAGSPPTSLSDQSAKHDKEISERAETRGDSGQSEYEGKKAEKEDPMREIHETSVNLLYILIVLHLAGVIFETRRSGRTIVLAMMPGR